MPLIYITGNSGAGKSSVQKELKRRGYEAYDTDENGISSWQNKATGEFVSLPASEADRTKAWHEAYAWMMSRQKVEELAAKAKQRTIFLCGSPFNADDMLDLYDKVICLTVDQETLKQRIANRTYHDFGKAPDELSNILGWHDSFQTRYRNMNAVMIDVAKSLKEVVDEVLQNANNALKLSVGKTSMQFLPIPAGSFFMGSTKQEIAHAIEEFPHLQAAWFEKEYPQHKVDVPQFYMSETPITNAQWYVFMQETGTNRMPQGFNVAKPDHPVWDITFEELSQFCAWLTAKSGCEVKIPTEAQWEKAARGTDRREYPWGNAFDKTLCNTKESKHGDTTPVGAFPGGKSPYGMLDMAGNVEEWTSTKYQPYPGGRTIHDRFGGPGDYYVTRGGSFDHEGDLARCARRHGGPYEHSIVGGRVAIELLP